MNTSKKLEGIELAFDVGHSSIGWAVIGGQPGQPDIHGCGTVIFGADDCLASKRREFRRQRRHIRATRLRIRRISSLLEHVGCLTRQELDRPGCAWPWLLSARVLKGGALLSWAELWDVLRWYAHNRGYDGNRGWSRQDEADDDVEKVNNARALYEKHGTSSMAETFCAVCGLDPLGSKKSCNVEGEKRPRNMKAAFPRGDVVCEVRKVLTRHIGTLPAMNEGLVKALLDDWQAVECPSVTLPGRFSGGYLFGQLKPRFDNRIIASCPITFERVYQSELKAHGDTAKAKAQAEKQAKVPLKECVEFYKFRWAMLLANIQATPPGTRQTRGLTLKEKAEVHAEMLKEGRLTKAAIKKAVRTATDGLLDNLDQLLIHPDAEEALVLDPIRAKIVSSKWLPKIWPAMSAKLQRTAANLLRRGQTLTLERLLLLEKDPDAVSKVMTAIESLREERAVRKGKNEKSAPTPDPMKETFNADLLSGRAPYQRAVLRAVWEDVMVKDIHPSAEGGVLFRSEPIRQAQLQRAIDEQTNNHLVRHRLRILSRLHQDILTEFASGDGARVRRVTIEVNRELKEYSGKTRKEQEQDLGSRLANFKTVTKRLEKAFEGKGLRIGPGLIRKARIAEDLGWACPYTGKIFDEFDLLNGSVDKDHIIPRSDRASDSLDSLVITFSAVNKMKGKRTAMQFIEEFQGKPVEGAPNLTVMTVKQYTDRVAKLESFKGHEDDQRRKKRRKDMLLLRDYVEKTFTPRDLTQTSQLVRLGAQVLQREYVGLGARAPTVTSLPGSVTGAIRKAWHLIGTLSKANPMILDEDGHPRTKTEIRGITHLHHALDASVLALAAHFIPNNGRVWSLLVKRDGQLNADELEELAALGVFARDSQGRSRLRELDNRLKDQLRDRLAERRVVQHIPSDMTGLSADQTVWRVLDPNDPHPSALRIKKWLAKAKVTIPGTDTNQVVITGRKRKEQPGESGKTLHVTATWRWVYDVIDKSKLLGLEPPPGTPASLKKIKAVKILGENYGIALDPEPQIIRFHKVFPQLRDASLKNNGKPPRVIRKGMLISIPSGKFKGIWRVFSAKASMKLDLGSPDRVRMESSGVGVQRETSLTTLMKNGMQILGINLSGVPSCPTTSSVSTAPTAP